MVDPLTAFSAAGNALQFLQLGITLVRKTVKYSSGGGENEHEALRDLSQRLLSSSSHLQTTMMQSAANGVQPGPARALHLANEECLRVCKEFFDFVNGLGLNSSNKPWKNVRVALKTMMTARGLDELCRKVEHARSNLILSLMVYLQDKTMQDSQAADNAIVRQTQQIMNETDAIKMDVESLGAKLQRLDIREWDLKTDIDRALSRHERELEHAAVRLSGQISVLNQDLGVLRGQTARLSDQMERETTARSRLIDSLYFQRMEDRRRRIVKAHTGTLQWIFQEQEDTVVVWHDFMRWLVQDTQPIYWVSGKPGSGKSTLMKELSDAVSVQPSIQQWLGQRELLTASFFFWLAGISEEKSMMGLLRSLVYQILSQRPHLVFPVVRPAKWQTALDPSHRHVSWDTDELKDVLQSILHNTADTDRVFLAIDGLDELDGSDVEREELVEFIQLLSKHQHIKICVSSRTWNLFQDAFHDFPQLRLQDLTRGDIRRYVYDKLERDGRFQVLQRRKPHLPNIISKEIVEKARGVFLWVYLAVRDLLRVLRDGGQPQHLLRELTNMPSDLDEYFTRIMASVDPRYRREASMILQTSICDLKPVNVHFLPHQPAFLLINLLSLDLFEQDQYFAAGAQIPFFNLGRGDEVEDCLASLKRVLASRCMGLLEVDSINQSGRSAGARFLLTSIEFLHRTVRDYLKTRPAQDLLQDYINGPIDAHLFRLNLLLIPALMMDMLTPPHGFALEHIGYFLLNLYQREDPNEELFLLYEKMVDCIKHPLSAERLPTPDLKAIVYVIMIEFMKCQHARGDDALSLAIQIGWRPYVKRTLPTVDISRRRGPPLLDCALRPCLREPILPDCEMVEDLLRRGARLGLASEDPHRSEYPPTWILFIITTRFLWADLLEHGDFVKTLKMIVEAEPGLIVTHDHLISALETVSHDLLGQRTNPGYLEERLERCRVSPGGMWKLPPTRPFYTFMEILRWLRTIQEPDEALSMLEESDLDMLEHLISQQQQSLASPNLDKAIVGKRRREPTGDSQKRRFSEQETRTRKSPRKKPRKKSNT